MTDIKRIPGAEYLRIFFFITALMFSGCLKSEPDKQSDPDKLSDPDYIEPQYHIYFGNTHSHCNYSGDIAISRAKQGLGLDPKNTAEYHFELARENGYQFYCLTDHSQYDVYTQEAFADVKVQAEKYTNSNFVGIRGYEHSENDGPDGKGHMNVYNSETYLNALAEGVGLEFFQNWISQIENKDVVACFNHPDAEGFNNFHCYNETAREHIRLIELINGVDSKYPVFVNALLKGWKVSPVAGCDNHGYQGIAKWEARTGIAAKALTYDALMEAIAAGRTYATFDKNLKLMYYVNDKPMGSTLDKGNNLHFSIEASDPDTSDPGDIIAKIEIIGENGTLVDSRTFSEHEIKWTVDIPAEEKYYYLVVYKLSMEEPVAYTAPVWIEQ